MIAGDEVGGGALMGGAAHIQEQALTTQLQAAVWSSPGTEVQGLWTLRTGNH